MIKTDYDFYDCYWCDKCGQTFNDRLLADEHECRYPEKVERVRRMVGRYYKCPSNWAPDDVYHYYYVLSYSDVPGTGRRGHVVRLNVAYAKICNSIRYPTVECIEHYTFEHLEDTTDWIEVSKETCLSDLQSAYNDLGKLIEEFKGEE